MHPSLCSPLVRVVVRDLCVLILTGVSDSSSSFPLLLGGHMKLRSVYPFRSDMPALLASSATSFPAVVVVAVVVTIGVQA